MVLHIAGTDVPLEAFKGVPRVLEDIALKAPPEKLLKDLQPVIVQVTAAVNPVAGLAVAGFFFLLAHSKPPTPEEQQRMWDQAQGVH